MQLLNKLSSLSDKLLPHTDFTVPLPLDACRERLENNLYLRVLPNSYQARPYKIYETHFEVIDREISTFFISFDGMDFKVIGRLESCLNIKTHVKASIRTPTSSRLIHFISIFIGHLFVFSVLLGGFDDSASALGRLLAASFGAIFPTLFWGTLITFIIFPISQRKRTEPFLKAVEFALKSN